MKILVIFTGGTIGSVENDGWVEPTESAKYTLINNYKTKYGNNVTFEFVEPYRILSENLSSKEINSLISCLKENQKSDFDGIIITHGTDSLQYMASALSLTVKCRIPVVMVSSNYSLSDPRSNGNQNFYGAVEFIKNQAGVGFFVSYKNTNEDRITFHEGGQLLSHTETTDEVFSLDYMPYAYLENKKLTILGKRNNDKIYENVTFCENPGILLIPSHPGDDFSYNLENRSAVLLAPYHSGTLNTSNENFKAFCQRAKEKKIEIFVANVRGGTTYSSSKLFNELNLNILPFSSVINAYMKLWIGVSLGEDLKKFIKK